jgi:hypothetical protein
MYIQMYVYRSMDGHYLTEIKNSDDLLELQAVPPNRDPKIVFLLTTCMKEKTDIEKNIEAAYTQAYIYIYIYIYMCISV